MHRKAILIIDIQNDFTGDNARMPVDPQQAQRMIFNINKLLDKVDRLKTQVVYIVNEYSRYDPFNIFRNFAAISGSTGAKPDLRLHIVSDVFFSKQKGNAFSNPGLDVYLKSQHVDEIYVCGLFAGACVYATVKGALKNNYKVNVLTDCIAAGSNRKLEKAIRKYEKAGAINTLSTAF